MNKPKIMAVLNLTPDSFSGDGLVDVQEALARFETLVRQGADVVDLGAESTRPGAIALSPAQEWARLEPVLAAIQQHPLRKRVALSVDTYHPQTAARAAMADMINDESGLSEVTMRAALASTDQQIVVMHALSVPADPVKVWEAGTDPVMAILAWKEGVCQRARQAGIDAGRLIYDPGLGFGKTSEQSLELLLRAGELVQSGGRWLVGHSRKSFFSLLSDAPAAARDDLTLLASSMLAQAGVEMIRVHEVPRHRALLDRLCM